MINHVAVSKLLSLVLRHNPSLLKLDMNKNGWVNIQQIIINFKLYKNLNIDFDIIRHIVQTSDKKRFVIDETGEKIRANQGHSIKVDLDLHLNEPPDFLFHGTATRFLDQIMSEGLKPMSRHQVHLSASRKTAFEVGRRHGIPVVLTVRAKEMYKNGFQFFISENKIWLVDRVPKEYFKLAQARQALGERLEQEIRTISLEQPPDNED